MVERDPDRLLRDALAIRALLDDLADHEHEVRSRLLLARDAVRLEAGGASLVYSGDTGATPALVELARDCDLLLCEASWPSEPPPPPGIHLTGREAGEHAARAGAGRTVLTHLMPYADPATVLAEARERYAGPLELARTGAVYDVTSVAR